MVPLFLVGLVLAGAVSAQPFKCPAGFAEETGNNGGRVCRKTDTSNGWICPREGWLKQVSTCVSIHEAERAPETQEARLKRLQPCWPGSSAQISDENQLFFVHIPKAGGSSVENSKLFDDRKRQGPIGGHHALSLSPFFTPGCVTYHLFTVVRNPGARLFSVWKYYAQRLGNKGDQAWVASHVSKNAQVVGSNTHTVVRAATYSSSDERDSVKPGHLPCLQIQKLESAWHHRAFLRTSLSLNFTHPCVVCTRNQEEFGAFVGELEVLAYRHQVHLQSQIGMLVMAGDTAEPTVPDQMQARKPFVLFGFSGSAELLTPSLRPLL